MRRHRDWLGMRSIKGVWKGTNGKGRPWPDSPRVVGPSVEATVKRRG